MSPLASQALLWGLLAATAFLVLGAPELLRRLNRWADRRVDTPDGDFDRHADQALRIANPDN